MAYKLHLSRTIIAEVGKGTSEHLLHWAGEEREAIANTGEAMENGRHYSTLQKYD